MDKRAFECLTQNVCDLITIRKVFFLVELKHLYNAFSVLDTVMDIGLQDFSLHSKVTGPKDNVKSTGNDEKIEPSRISSNV